MIMMMIENLGQRVSERVPTRRSNPPSAIITQIVPHRPTKEYSRKYGKYSVTMLVASSREMISSYGAWCRLGYMCGWYSRPFAFEDIW